ncbi:hypothetical protein DF018_13375 [Burkholderia cenocepacia]|nr:hypothetical protein DF018_13375 [Burkholderia cenocepacia]
MRADLSRPLWSAPAEPWRNNGGTTQLLVSSPVEGDWRISLAQVDQDGRYSRFEGMQRTSVVVGGDGLTLQHLDTEIELAPHVPVSFDGALDWHARLHGGAVKALNAMVRKDRYQATMRVLHSRAIVASDKTAVVVSLSRAVSYSVGDTGVAGLVPPGFWITLSSFTGPLRLTPIETDPAPGDPGVSVLVTIAAIHEEDSL